MRCIWQFRKHTHHNFDRYGLLLSLLDEHLYYLLSSIPPLQPIQFSVSGADDRPLIALGTTTFSIAFSNNKFRVQYVVTRNILFPVVLGINFLQTHDGIISFLTNQLYLTNSSLKCQPHSQYIRTTHEHFHSLPSTLTHPCSSRPTLSYHQYCASNHTTQNKHHNDYSLYSSPFQKLFVPYPCP